MTAQIIDPISRQHTATTGLRTFDEFHTKAMQLAKTNCSIAGKGGGASIEAVQNVEMTTERVSTTSSAIMSS